MDSFHLRCLLVRQWKCSQLLPMLPSDVIIQKKPSVLLVNQNLKTMLVNLLVKLLGLALEYFSLECWWVLLAVFCWYISSGIGVTPRGLTWELSGMRNRKMNWWRARSDLQGDQRCERTLGLVTFVDYFAVCVVSLLYFAVCACFRFIASEHIRDVVEAVTQKWRGWSSWLL